MLKKLLASCVVVGLMASPVLANQNVTKKEPKKVEKKAPAKAAASKTAKPQIEGC